MRNGAERVLLDLREPTPKAVENAVASLLMLPVEREDLEDIADRCLLNRGLINLARQVDNSLAQLRLYYDGTPQSAGDYFREQLGKAMVNPEKLRDCFEEWAEKAKSEGITFQNAVICATILLAPYSDEFVEVLVEQFRGEDSFFSQVLEIVARGRAF